MIKPVLAGEVRRNLTSKGFVEVHQRDHHFFFLQVGDKRSSFFVKLSHGATEIRRDEIKNSARTFRISGDLLFRILNCDADRQETLAAYAQYEKATRPAR